jgi:hypothetical protein
MASAIRLCGGLQRTATLSARSTATHATVALAASLGWKAATITRL